MQIIVFSTTTSPYSLQLEDYLKSKKVAYEGKNIDLDEKAFNEMEKISGGFFGVPFTYIKDDQGRTDTILGFDRGKIDTILGLS